MKNLFVILLASVLSLSVNDVNAQKSQETIIIKTKIYCDHCMQCNSCGKNIDFGIRDNKGIRKVKINPEKNTITVTYRPDKTNPEEIRKAISEAGFDADDIKASPEGYAKLDGCCKAK